MRYIITHTTTYSYSDKVSVSHHVTRLQPRQMPGQKRLACEQQIQPSPAERSEHEDYFGNAATFFAIHEPHEQLVVRVRSEVELSDEAALPKVTPPWEIVRDSMRKDLEPPALAAYEFVFDSPLIKTSAEFAAYAAQSFPPRRALMDGVVDLTRRIHEDFTFDAKATNVATPLSDVFKSRRGVCQDFAQFQIACLRSLGLPAWYVSGYVETTPPAGQTRLAGADASHAWVSVYCPGAGSIAVDPTNNLVPANRHVTLAWGRDFSDVSPVRGVILGGGKHGVHVAVDVVAPAGPP